MKQPRTGTGESALERLATLAFVHARLRALAAMLNLRPRFRRHLEDAHPCGAPFVFNATYLFTTRGGGTAVHAVFRDGRMRVRSGACGEADVTVRFRSLAAMRAFFTTGSDSLAMLLANELSFDGNMSMLFKFGHMSASVERGDAKAAPKVPWRRGPGRWQDLAAPRPGEPCRERPAGEVTHLEDPYLAACTLDDFPLVKRQLWVHRTRQPEVCAERPRLLTDHVLRARAAGAAGESPVLRQARALHAILAGRQPVIHDDDLLAGTTTSKRVGVLLFPESGGTWIWPELLTMEARELNPYRISGEDIAVLERQVFPFWMEDNIRDWAYRTGGRPLPMQLDQRMVLYFMWKTQTVSHTVIDVPRALSRGLADISREAAEREAAAADPAARDFYRALQVALAGVTDYARRLSRHAALLAEGVHGDGPGADDQRRRLRDMAAMCARVPEKPAETLAEALQAVWILFLCQHQESMNAGLAVGRLDYWLEPYFRRDMEKAATPDEKRRAVARAVELVCAFMLKLTDHLPLVPDIGNRLFGGSSSDQVITLGGLAPDGGSAVGDMTWIFLKATEMLRLRDPNVNARYAPGVNSRAYLRRLCEVNKLTGATPSLHNDAAMVPALVAQGFAVEHARDWTATGCVEPTSCGRHYGHTNCMMFNMVAPLEMALNDGRHPVLGEQVGPRTGDPRGFGTYDDFLRAYKEQLGWLIDRSVECNNLLGAAHRALKPTPLLSALFDGPMEKGRDVIDGGARYNSSGTAMIGLTDVVDSLSAVKTLVYGRGKVGFDTLLAALDGDFSGHEELLAQILGGVPKFGQDHELPARIARDLQDFVFDRFQAHANYRGGKYLPGYWSMSNHVAFGSLSGALPSGRRRGKAFTPGLTPSHLGAAPLTDQIRAVAGLDTRTMPNNLAFNVKVVPGAQDSHGDVVDRMTAYVASYFELGGMQMQFNVVSTATLRDAVRRPDEHRDLIVRISGYNAYFVELNRDIQNELIERMEHHVGR